MVVVTINWKARRVVLLGKDAGKTRQCLVQRRRRVVAIEQLVQRIEQLARTAHFEHPLRHSRARSPEQSWLPRLAPGIRQFRTARRMLLPSLPHLFERPAADSRQRRKQHHSPLYEQTTQMREVPTEFIPDRIVSPCARSESENT